MRKIFRILFLLVAFITPVEFVHAQKITDEPAPSVNRPCPDFSLSKVDYFRKKNINLQDFKGKWLVLDFWSKTCASCISGFPKINLMQKEFPDNVQFLLIGNNSQKYNSGIKPMFDRIRKYQNLDLPIAYDSLMFNLFKVRSTPATVVIDPNGIIRLATSTGTLTVESLKELMKGKQHLQESISKNDFVISAVLSRWTNEIRSRPIYKMDDNIGDAGFSVIGAPLYKLYNLAYFGETDWSIRDSVYGFFWKKPILELKDSTLFFKDLDKQIGYYNYDLKVPKGLANKAYVQFAMQCDLKKVFRYEVSIEKRMMPCWELIAEKDAFQKLRSASNELIIYSSDHSGFNASGLTIRNIIQSLYFCNQSGFPLFDRTGIDFLIDMHIDADLTNFNDFRVALSKHGLTLILAHREMSVIVIKDETKKRP